MSEEKSKEPNDVGDGATGKEADGGADVPTDYIELYKLAVEMADRVSARRGNANSFFVTVNTALLAFLGLAELKTAWPVAVGGVFLSLTWALLIKSYRDLNTAKYKVINEAEKDLPLKVFNDEWQILKKDPPESLLTTKDLRGWLKWYVEFTIVEMIVPLVFAALYLAILIF